MSTPVLRSLRAGLPARQSWRSAPRRTWRREPTRHVEFGALLRDLIAADGRSGARIAAAAGIDHSYLSRLSRGDTRAPSRDVIIALADVLGCDPADRWRLMAAVGVLPVPWDDALADVAVVLHDPRLSAEAVDGFRGAVSALAEAWIHAAELAEHLGGRSP